VTEDELPKNWLQAHIQNLARFNRLEVKMARLEGYAKWAAVFGGVGISLLGIIATAILMRGG
jgi:hypothetical protein